jgi:hypothetical protein
MFGPAAESLLVCREPVGASESRSLERRDSGRLASGCLGPAPPRSAAPALMRRSDLGAVIQR